MRTYAALFTLVVSALGAPLEPCQSCADVTVYFARGTTKPGTLGLIVGPPFRRALQSALGSRSLQFIGINYPATIPGFLAGGDQGGATTMANSVTSRADSCPDTKIIKSGYSQGAQVTHLVAGKLPSTIQNRVNAAVVFGDPKKGQTFPGPIAGRSKTFCAAGDNICAGGLLILPPHFGYGADAPAAAAFVLSQI